MSFEGMDVEQADGLATRIDTQARVLDDVVATVDTAVRTLGSVWAGQDAEQFARVWAAGHRTQAVAAAAALHDAGTQLRRQIAEQQSASDAWEAASGGLLAGALTVLTPDPGTAPGITSTSPHDKAWVTTLLGAADYSYGNAADPPPGLTTQEVIDDQATGFRAVVLSYTEDGQTKYVVAFAGSSMDWKDPDGMVNDWVINDLGDGLGSPTPQYVEATAYAKVLAAKYGAENITFTGHSLGGGQASVASIATGSNAVTFNAAEPGVADQYIAQHPVLAALSGGGLGLGLVGSTADLVNGVVKAQVGLIQHPLDRLTNPGHILDDLKGSRAPSQTIEQVMIHPDTSHITAIRTAGDQLSGFESAADGENSPLGTNHVLQPTSQDGHGLDDVRQGLAGDAGDWWSE